VTTFIAYDVTRLLMRYTVPTPNGIDRIDLAYAHHFLGAPKAARAGAFLHGLQPALIESRSLVTVLAAIDQNWRYGSPNSGPTYDDIKQILLGRVPKSPSRLGPLERLSKNLKAGACRLAPLRMLNPKAFKRALFDRLPTGAVFIHTTHYPFEYLFRWLELRRDVKAVFFIHDLLPLQFPEYFEPTHIAWHLRSLNILARYGHAAIVNTHVVERQVLDFLRSRGRQDVRVLALPIPPDPAFVAAYEVDPDLVDTPYFVMCGTIEPRKNQVMLLQVWRELARQWGIRTPKLVLVGKRGWENENVVDLLDRSLEIHKHVIEVTGLPTSALARLIAGARALLMPSFAEGYGLPIIEARAVGIPVIASDIPVFREIAAEATFLPPLDGTGWLTAVQAHTELKDRRLVGPRSDALRCAEASYFTQIEDFICSL
jgi:glycosyltransferase involved in cell wall biosynthesis